MTAKKEVKTEGTLEEMAKVTNVDQKTIAGAIEVVENAANIEIDVPQKENK